MFVEYCVAPNYPLYFSVALTSSINKPQNKPSEKYLLQSVDQLWAVQVCHNSKCHTIPHCLCAGLF